MKITKHKQIRNTVIIGFSVLGFLVIITGVIGLYFVNNVVRVLHDVTDYAAPLVTKVDDLIENLYGSAGIAGEILDTRDSTTVRDIIIQFDLMDIEFEKAWNETENLATGEDLQKKLHTAFSRQQQFNTIAHTMFSRHLNSLEMESRVSLLLEDIDRNRSMLLSKLNNLVFDDTLIKNKTVYELTGENVLVLNAIRNLQHHIIQLQRILREYLTEENPDQLIIFEKDYQNLIARGEQAIELIERQLPDSQKQSQGFRTNWNSWRDLVFMDEGLFSTYRNQRFSENQARELTERCENEIEIAVASLENIALAAQKISNNADDREIVVSAPLGLYVTIFLSIVIICFMGIVIFRFITFSGTQIENTMGELERSKDELSSLARHLQEIREEERALISHEIHDELGQALTALQIDAALMSKEIPDNAEYLHKKNKSMIELIQATIINVQKISARLRPVMLDRLGLQSAVRWHTDEFRKRTGISCHVDFECHKAIDDEKISIALFRILQESLTNITRHAGASGVAVHLKYIPGTIRLIIEDDGKGITEEQIHDSRSFGIMGMKERIKSLHGELVIKGRKGEGTTVEVILPTNGV